MYHRSKERSYFFRFVTHTSSLLVRNEYRCNQRVKSAFAESCEKSNNKPVKIEELSTFSFDNYPIIINKLTISNYITLQYFYFPRFLPSFTSLFSTECYFFLFSKAKLINFEANLGILHIFSPVWTVPCSLKSIFKDQSTFFGICILPAIHTGC